MDIKKQKDIWTGYFGNDRVNLSYINYNPDRINHEILRKKIETITKISAKFDIGVFFKPLLDKQQLKTWYGGDFNSSIRCFYPWTNLRIAPDGEVFTCPIIRFSVGNVKKNKLRRILNNARYCQFRRALRGNHGLFPACARCCKLHMSPWGNPYRSSRSD